MWKWVTVLCLGMYVTLMAFGGDGYDPDEVAAPPKVSVETPEVAAIAPENIQPELSEPEVSLSVPTSELTPQPEPVVATAEAELPTPSQSSTVKVTSTEIEPIAPVADPITISAAPTATVTRESTVEDDPKPDLPIWRVTGSRVNLRAAANAQAQIVGRTVRGDSAEIIELLSNGWAKVYIIDSGIEAYMSADYIAPDG